MNRKERRSQQALGRHGQAPDTGPGSAAALFAQAGAAFRVGRMTDSEALLRRTLRLNPSHAEAHYWLGIICQQKGAAKEALKHLKKAVALVPASADCFNALGIAELQLGDLEAAERSFKRARELNPALAAVHYNLASALRAHGKWDEAVASLRRSLELAPDHADAQIGLGRILVESAQFGEAVAHFGKLVAAAPNWQEARMGLLEALKASRRFDDAETEARRIFAAAPDSARSHDDLALFLWSIGRYAKAEAEARRALELDPKLADAHNTLGTILTTLGRFDEAIACFEAALEIRPDCPDALTGLTNLSKAYSTAPMAKRVEAALEQVQSMEQKAMLHFVLGKIYEDLGQFDLSFRHRKAANEVVVPESSFDSAEWHSFVDRTIATFTPEFFARHRPLANPSRRPIFIFGMPRSGTSLVENILASHPDVAGGGELQAIPELVAGLVRRPGTPHQYPARQYPECVADIDEAAARDLARSYLDVLEGVDGTASHVTDKSPLNFQYLGLMALLFPNAAFVHCRRDALDTCLSCFFSTFGRYIEFKFRLEDLGAYYRGYRRLMDHWRTVLPAAMLEIDYEELVADQEAVSRKLIAHCGLEWDDRCLQFYEADRGVRTASVWQVRQPIYKSAVNRWRRFESHLGPLIEALKD